jgi:DNA-directed RNA polymerase subunit alpha
MHCLESADIHTVGDLVKWKRSDLLKLRNFGLHTIREIEDFLTDHDLTFGMKVKEA